MKRSVLTSLFAVAIAGVAIITLAGCSTPTIVGHTSAATDAANVGKTSFGKELASLPVKAKLPLTNYRRLADFGPAWTDITHDGCDPRNDALKRDLTNITMSGSCEVTSGTLHDPYTGKIIHFVRGEKTSMAVQIDHLVPLANAWAEGAQGLTFSQREHLANDSDELLSVDGPTNESKGDDDASQWLPAMANYRCTYVEKQITVKVRYHLWVTPPEHAAMVDALTGCGIGTMPPTSPTAAPTGLHTHSATPVAQTIPKPTATPAQTAKTVSPGGYCDTKGATGKSKAGKTYTCGAKGPDKSGRFHWNS
jgi:hypothetical protein